MITGQGFAVYLRPFFALVNTKGLSAIRVSNLLPLTQPSSTTPPVLLNMSFNSHSRAVSAIFLGPSYLRTDKLSAR